MSSHKMRTYLEADTTKRQHKKPCGDCPFARSALPGWLAGMIPDEYCQMAHMDIIIDCHTKKQEDGEFHQCAGAAIYRSNVIKSCRDGMLELPGNRETVFATPMEFLEHHRKSLPLIEERRVADKREKR